MNDSLQLLAVSPAAPYLIFFFGLIFGSFFNVCIYRLPRDISVADGRSKCPTCRTPIPWYLNIPVFSYIYLRGRCAACRKPISLEYPVVELVSGLLFLSIFRKFGLGVPFLCYVVFSSSLLVISVIDLHHRIIPDELSLSGVAIGFIVSFFLPDPGWKSSLAGILSGGGLFLGIAYLYEKWTRREGLGGGDVKLLAMLGAWLGVQSLLILIVLSSAAGSLVGIVLILIQGKNLKTSIPFGPFLAGAGLVLGFCACAVAATIAKITRTRIMAFSTDRW